MILLVDNYDSFTYNLAQMIEPFHELVILRNDDPKLSETAKVADAIIFSPGPGWPADAGSMELLILEYYQTKPMLGICLGHQALAEVFGGRLAVAKEIRHGKESAVRKTPNSLLFKTLPDEFQVMRYHSLVVEKDHMPDSFIIAGVACDDHEVMAMEHEALPIFGMQFHPESIGTPQGEQMIQQFLTTVRGI
jgi:anthranilate synthase component 2